MVVNKVELCGVNTSKLPLLREKEKEELFRRIRQGDKLAREEYIKGNLRLVLSVMKRFDSSNENADDLFQIGCVGLVKAVDNRRYLRDNSSLRVSRSLRDIAYKVIYTREGYIRKNMKEPSIQEIAEEIGLSKEEVVYALDAVQTPMSLQEPVYNDGGDALYVMDQVSDKKNREENWVEELSLEAAMERLNERERRLIRLRFFEGKTQMEVSEQIGISQAQVSRLEKNALKTMRQYLLGK